VKPLILCQIGLGVAAGICLDKADHYDILGALICSAYACVMIRSIAIWMKEARK
jgi:hypothetical protein